MDTTTPEPLDVLHVVPSLGVGGAEQQLTLLTTAARGDPLRQRVVYFLDRDEMAGRIRSAGVPVDRIAIGAAWQAPFALVALARTIRRHRPRAIQSWLYYGDLLAAGALALSGRRGETRLYWGVRCSDIALADYSRLLRVCVRACAKLSGYPNAVVANSHAGRAAHIAFGYAARAFTVIANGIDTERFRPDPTARARLRAEFDFGETEFVVLHVARIDPMKDHAMLVALAAALPRLRFVAIGEGTETLDGPPNLMRLGVRRDVPQWLAAGDALISTSRYGEGFSNVIAEAMAAGLPVIATDVGDAARIVGDAGFVAAPSDRASLADALNKLAAMPSEGRAALGRRARQRIQDRFSVAASVEAFDVLHRFGRLPAS